MSNTSQGTQDVIYTETFKLGPHTCEIQIKSDAYRFQCHAIAKVWSATSVRWNHAASIHFSQMETAGGLAYGRTIGEEQFLADRNILLQLRRDIFD